MTLLFQPEGLRLRAIGRIKSLTVLDGHPVTEAEAAAALRMAAGSRVSQVHVVLYADKKPLICLIIAFFIPEYFFSWYKILF